MPQTTHPTLLAILTLLGAVLLQPAGAAAQACAFEAWQTYNGDTLFRHREKDVYYFVTEHMAVDADGAPNAYHPDNTGLDLNANAGYPNSTWWPSVLVPDPADPSKAFVQPGGDFAGFFIAKTALQDPNRAATDPARYVDATTVPYLVFPGSFAQMKGTGRLGDFGVAIHLESGLHTPFIVADIGPSKADLGEVSIALAEALGGQNVSPRTGAGVPGGKVAYAVFRLSSDRQAAKRWRLPEGEIARRADALLETIGGLEALRACLG